jgi:hypothetical protein
MADSADKKPRAVASPPTTLRTAKPIHAIPKSPDVDEDALARSERITNREQEPRRRRKRPPTVTLFVKCPEPVNDAFLGYMKREEFRTRWEALEALMLKAGIAVEDFDI